MSAAGGMIADVTVSAEPSLLERRYRRLLRVLPPGYRERWADDMVDTFLDVRAGTAADEESYALGRPGASDAADVLALAVRLRLQALRGRVDPAAAPRTRGGPSCGSSRAFLCSPTPSSARWRSARCCDSPAFSPGCRTRRGVEGVGRGDPSVRDVADADVPCPARVAGRVRRPGDRAGPRRALVDRGGPGAVGP